MKVANALAALLVAASSASATVAHDHATNVKEDDSILLGGLLRGSFAGVTTVEVKTDVLGIFEQQTKVAFGHEEDFDVEEDALEYDFEGKHAGAELGELGCRASGVKCKMPFPRCCGDYACRGSSGNKTCQCVGPKKGQDSCSNDNECCSGKCKFTNFVGGKVNKICI